MKKILCLALFGASILGANELESKCSQNDLKACIELGKTYFEKQNYEKAIKFVKKACDGGDVDGCYGLGLLYNEGVGTIKQDYVKAKEYFVKACDGGENKGCLKLGLLYYNKQGTKQDYIKAREYFVKACDGGNNDSCFNLGGLYYNGQSVRQDKKQAKEYFGKACDLGHQKGCDAYRYLNEQGY